jgi:hypothetical protein
MLKYAATDFWYSLPDAYLATARALPTVGCRLAGHLVRMVPICMEAWSAAPCLLTALTASSVIPAKVRIFIDCIRTQLTHYIGREDV